MTSTKQFSTLCLEYIRELNTIRQKINISKAIEFLLKDLSIDEVRINKDYIDDILSKIPSQDMPIFLEKISEITEPKTVSHKLALFFLNHERPVFQEKGMNLVENINDPDFIPLIIDVAISSHSFLREKAIGIILKINGNSECILEDFLKSKSKIKRNFAKEVLIKLNPKNVALNLTLLKDPDFIIRSKAIEIIGNSQEAKYLKKLEKLLDDQDLSVKRIVIEQIAKFNGKKAKKILYHSLVTEEHPPLKRFIENIIQSIE